MTDEPLDLAHSAQEAAYERLEAGELVLMYEDNQDDEIDAETYRKAAESLSAPFCGCMTCVVREVISAAWPYLAVLAVEQYNAAMSDPEIRRQLEELGEKIKQARGE